MNPPGKRNGRQMLQLALAAAAGHFRAKEFSEAPVFRRARVAFDNGVGLTVVGLETRDAQAATRVILKSGGSSESRAC